MKNTLPEYEPSGHNMPPRAFQQAAPEDLNKNRLVEAVMPILTLISQLRHTVDHPDVTTLRSQINEELDKALRSLQASGYAGETILASQYCLCTALDEAVLSHTWGSNSAWAQNSLLNIRHEESWGGENFYVILENKLKALRKHIDFIELIYFLLSLGYEGKFHGDTHRAAREEIRNKIFYRIRQSRQKPDKTLSNFWKNEEQIQPVSVRKRRLKRVILMTLVITLIVAIIDNVRLDNHATIVTHTLSSIGTVSPITTFSQVINRPLAFNTTQH